MLKFLAKLLLGVKGTATLQKLPEVQDKVEEHDLCLASIQGEIRRLVDRQDSLQGALDVLLACVYKDADGQLPPVVQSRLRIARSQIKQRVRQIFAEVSGEKTNT